MLRAASMFENKSNQDALICDFLKLRKIAVVGSFRNEMKVTYAIIRHLLAAQKYEIFPVNPAKKEVEGLKVYAGILDLPGDIGFVNIVTPPEVTLKVLEFCIKKSITKAWLQPGASDEKVVAFCMKNGITFINDTCIMLHS